MPLVDELPGFVREEQFYVRKHADEIAFQDIDTISAEAALLECFEKAIPGTIIVVDFSNLRIASAAARQLLKRLILRIRSGELADRYLVLGDLGDNHYNVHAMLVRESLTAIERTIDEGPQLLGIIDPAVQATYQYLLASKTTTASQVQTHFNLNNVSTATNRLTSLSKLGLARRVEQRSVTSGGREYVYAAVR